MNTLDSNTRGVAANLCANIGLAARSAAAGGDLSMARTMLHAEIMALNTARTCAMQGDATTIFARINDLIIERQTVLQQLQQGGGL